MILRIDPTSPKPVYQQIIDQVKYAVAAGRLREGDRLGPIRDVAVQIRVNRNTVARAYTELEREGIIHSKPGQGSFISDGGSGLSKARARKMIAGSIDDLLAQAHQFRMDEDEVLSLVRDRMARLKPRRKA
jgi:GntR family transcriptional regulator